MKIILIFALAIATALSRPQELSPDKDGHIAVYQSSNGQYRYSVLLRDSSKTEERSEDGTVNGEYTVLVDGIPQTFKYRAGKDGFQILEGPVPVAPVDNAVAPVPVSETDEVLAARAAHQEAVAAAAAASVIV